MPQAIDRKIVDLEWPSRYLLECGHAVAIAPDASAAEMKLPGQALPCAACAGGAEADAAPGVTPFKAGEPINALTLNARLREIEALIAQPGALRPFRDDEPINATSLNSRLSAIAELLRERDR